MTLSLDGREFVEDFHIYPQVSRVLLSWKAAKGLGILPECYPRPPKVPYVAAMSSSEKQATCGLIAEFPTVFDGRVKVMN